MSINTSAVTTSIAAQIRAVTAMGVIVQVEPSTFLELIAREPDALVVHATGRLFFSVT